MKKRKTAFLENFYETIFDNTQIGLSCKDKHSKYLGCNKVFAKNAGLLNPDEIVGKTDYHMPWKISADKLKKNDEKAIQTGKLYVCEESLLLANGKKVVFLSKKFPLVEQNKITGLISVSFDIIDYKETEKETEKQLKNNRKYFKKLAQSIIGSVPENIKNTQEYAKIIVDYLIGLIHVMPGHIYWKNKKGEFLGCNQNVLRMHKFKHFDEIIGKTYEELFPPVHAKRMRLIDEQIMQKDKTETLEEISFDDRIYLTQKTPLHDNQSNVIGILGVSMDITERDTLLKALKKEKERAEAANRAKTRFLENMRHDIRTPLAGIIGFAETIKEASNNPEKVENCSNNLIASGRRLMDVLNGILEIIKIAGDEIPLLKQKFNLKTHLEAILQLNQAKAQSKQLQLTLQHDEKIPYLIGDSFRISRIALELITNALNFTEKGFVKVSTKLADSKNKEIIIKLIVQDTGVGIPIEKQKVIFKQFERLTPSHEGIYKGLGLGLTMVKKFVEDMGGEIFVESVPQQGTTFVCTLPLEKALLNEAGEDVSLTEMPRTESFVEKFDRYKPSFTESASRQAKILLIEDDAFTAEAEKNVLSTLNVSIDIADSGKTALMLFAKNAYDLVFMDIGLPDMTGYEVSRKMRLIEKNNNPIPIIALSAHSNLDHS